MNSEEKDRRRKLKRDITNKKKGIVIPISKKIVTTKEDKISNNNIYDIDKFFKNKNIIIVGPSFNVLDDCKYIDVDSYDIVVRLNSHDLKEGDRKIIGYRTDWIYHCLSSLLVNQKLVDDWETKKIKIISRYSPIERPVDKYNYNGFYFIEDSNFIINLKKEIGCNPSTGVVSIIHFLSLNIKSLTVVGYDFYQTLYNNDNNEKLRKQIMKNKHGVGPDKLSHNPSLQFEYIKDNIYLKDNRFMPLGFLKKVLDGEIEYKKILNKR